MPCIVAEAIAGGMPRPPQVLGAVGSEPAASKKRHERQPGTISAPPVVKCTEAATALLSDDNGAEVTTSAYSRLFLKQSLEGCLGLQESWRRSSPCQLPTATPHPRKGNDGGTIGVGEVPPSGEPLTRSGHAVGSDTGLNVADVDAGAIHVCNDQPPGPCTHSGLMEKSMIGLAAGQLVLALQLAQLCPPITSPWVQGRRAGDGNRCQ